MIIATDLTNCDKEPIHTPGKIQGHGFLIVTDRYFTIVSCSENISGFLPVKASFLLDKPLKSLESYFQMNDAGNLLQACFSQAKAAKSLNLRILIRLLFQTIRLIWSLLLKKTVIY